MNVFELIKEKLEEKKVCGGMRALTYNQGLCDAIDSVDEVAQKYNNGWIPCSERLPEKQGSYLIQDNHNNIKVAYYDYNTQCTYRAWWIDYTKVNVVAWRELPAPYKEGGTE